MNNMSNEAIKVRLKNSYVRAVVKVSCGYKDVNTGKFYLPDEIDFKCPEIHLKNADVGDQIMGDYTDTHCFGFTPVKQPRNIRQKIDAATLEAISSIPTDSITMKVDFSAKKQFIDHVDIVVTHECPNRCKFCIDKFINTDTRRVKIESIKKFLTLISHHANDGIEVLLLGGEPSAVGVEYLREIANAIRSFGFSPIISTNNHDRNVWVALTEIFDWVQITVHSKNDIEFLLPYKDNVNIKIAGDKAFSIDRMRQFIEDTKPFLRRSVSMYFTPDFKELCEDEDVWSILDTLNWERNGSYLYAFFQGVRFKKCIPGETNIIDEPTVPKLYPNGNYNKTWCNELNDDYLNY